MTFSRFMAGTSYRALMAPDGVVAGGAAPGAGTEPLAPAAAEGAPAPAAEPAVAASPAAPAGEKPVEPAAPAPGAAPQKEFAPSLLDEAATPAADPAKPADPAPAKDAAKPDDGKPPAPKEPTAEPAKPADAKPADLKPAEPPAPIEYAFTYPEGVKPEDVDTERMGAFTGILNEVRAAPEAGQKLLNLHLEEMTRVAQETETRVSERQWDVFQRQQKEAREEVMADPELGGSRHDTAKRTIMGFIDSYLLRESDGKPRSADVIAAEKKQLMDDFRATGIANRRSLLHLLHWAGEKNREGTPRPAPPARVRNPDPAQRGLRRYQGTTPASNGAG